MIMKLELGITGMSCQHCVKSVKRELEQIPGISILDVTIGKAMIELEELPDFRKIINDAIEKAGYTIETIS